MADTKCNGYIEVDFSSFIFVNNTMKVIQYTNLGDIPISIAVNASNLHSYVKEENYCPIGGIDVPDPCNVGTTINVDCVNLKEVIVAGPINYTVGIDVIDTTGRNPVVTPEVIPGVSVDLKGKQGKTATASGSIYINDEILLYLDSLSSPAPNIKVTLTKLIVHDHLDTLEVDNYYEINGTFKIEKV